METIHYFEVRNAGSHHAVASKGYVRAINNEHARMKVAHWQASKKLCTFGGVAQPIHPTNVRIFTAPDADQLMLGKDIEPIGEGR